MKKRLNIDSITNELEGASAFFSRPTPPPTARQETNVAAPRQPRPAKPKQSASGNGAEHRDAEPATPARVERPDSNQASGQAIMLASYPDSTIETIRKAVKQVGREVTFVRLTPEEKNQLGDIVYTYKRQNVKTSENEISRIAISYLLEDYKANGQESILAKVIASLLA